MRIPSLPAIAISDEPLLSDLNLAKRSIQYSANSSIDDGVETVEFLPWGVTQ